MHTRFFLILVIELALRCLPLNAQNYTMNGTAIHDCSGTFFDSGGETGNYGNNENLTTTICSDGTSGTHIRLSFSGTDIAPGDQLCIYDGVNLAAPLLACHTDYNPGSPFLIQATAANPSGCLTVSFVSDGSGTGTGWAAAISCVASCQTIHADLVSTNPASIPADTGWIDICPGERVFFNGKGIYPQNNFAYGQSDLTTTFEWNFGDGGIGYGPNTSHRFDKPGGYYVQLVLTDTMGCKNTNLIDQRVRVAARPTFQLNQALDQTICAGDTIHLSASTQGGTNTSLTVIPDTASFQVEGSRSDSLALPDGTGIPYETSIFFTEFSPGQVMTSANDLESICVNMEHSWARDVEISLTCPNGQSIILHDHPGNFGGEVFLGEPNDNDNVNPIPGVGYDYCWTNNAPNPTWLEYANTVLGGSGTIPSGDYTPFQPISDLVGCPLNGEWTIKVIDWWPIDNGFIFNWSLKFKDALYPNIESFSPQFTSWEWGAHPSIFYSSSDSIAASPQNAGTAGYTFTVHDAFGCTWDTLLTVNVLPPTHPNCHTCAQVAQVLKDTTICAGGSALLDGATLAPPSQIVHFEAFPDYKLGNGNHPHSNPYFSPVNVSSLGYSLLTLPTQQITEVCMDIETDYDSDLNIYLQAPSGQLLELSTGNGGSGDNYKITCFSPTASTSIIGQSAPFNGTYKPEGSWNALQGAAVNGNWSLRVSDGFAPNQYGKVKWWSIGFKVNNNVTYSWTNTATLSCGACANPLATPGSDTQYSILAQDAFGCTYHDTVEVKVLNFFPAPTGLAIINLGGGAMTWGWDAVPGALGYEVSVDGGPWQPANGNLSHTISGLGIGQAVSIEVRAVSPSCTPLSVHGNGNYLNCTLMTMLDAVGQLHCAGDSTGSVDIAAAGGDPPYTFLVDNWPGSFASGTLTNLFPGGNHSVIVRDMNGCADTVHFVINGPPPLAASLSSTAVLCHGGNSGSVQVNATGGSAPFHYLWQPCSGGASQSGQSATGLTAGCYSLTVTDDNGCQLRDTISVGEAPAFAFQTAGTPVSCHGLGDGSAMVTASGATPPYSFLWDNGQTLNHATALAPGAHTVSVTDAAACQDTAQVFIPEPAVLLADSTLTQAVSCSGGTNGAATVYPQGGTAPYAYLWSGGQNTQKALNIAAGIHQVTVTDAHGCTAQTSVNVPEPMALNSTLVNIQAEHCAGACDGQASVHASGGTAPYQYLWSAPSIPPMQANATALCSGNYQVTVQDAHGCANTQSFAIAPGVQLQSAFTLSQPSCAGVADGSATVMVSGGSTPYQFVWENGATTAGNPNLLCGVHSVTVADANGCSRTDTITLDCPVAVVLDSVAAHEAICFGQSTGSATVYAQGGTQPYLYLWNDAGAQTAATAQNLSAGNYMVTLTDAHGCSLTATASVGQPAALTAATSSSAVSCFGFNNGSTGVLATGGKPPYSYLWSNGALTTQVSNLTAGAYTVTVSDASGCTSSAGTAVAQPTSGVSLLASQLQAACNGAANGKAQATASGGNGGPYSYMWSNGAQTAIVSDLAPGNYSVTVTDQAGCTASQQVHIAELEKVTVNVAFVPPTCFGLANGKAAVNLISGGIGMMDSSMYHYNWSVAGSADNSHIFNLAGGQNYSLTVSDFQGCTGTYSFFVNQPLPITFNHSIEEISCFGMADGSVTISNVANAVGTVNYSWNNTSTSARIDQLSQGVYTVTVSDAKGCQTVETYQLQEPQELALSFQMQPLICAGDSNGVLTALVTGGTPGFQYSWSNGGNGMEINNLSPGQYTVTISDTHGCTLSGSETIDPPNALNIGIENTDPVCFGAQNGKIKLLINGGAPPYRYSINNGPLGGSNTFLALRAGVYAIAVHDGNGCISNLQDTLTQPPAIVVSLPSDTTIVLGDSLQILAEASNVVGMPHFTWTSNLVDTFYCLTPQFCEEIIIKPFLSNVYRAIVTDNNGCSGSAAIAVKVNKPHGIYVPTAFSPNGDLTNDLLLVHGLSRQVREVISFQVYDRWGELLYQDQHFPVNEVSRGWNGQFRGQDCLPGVYVWTLEAEYIDGHRESLHGDVTLVR